MLDEVVSRRNVKMRSVMAAKDVKKGLPSLGAKGETTSSVKFGWIERTEPGARLRP